jgi:predicted transglutaminase-like cysteine proteinase
MQRVQLAACVLLGGIIAATGVCAQDVSAFPSIDAAVPSDARSPSFMRIFGSAQPPHGFVRFCDSVPKECSADQRQESRFDASVERLRELDDVNRAINRSITPATDLEIYGVNEYWTLPRTKGDCEDYALLKRHALIEKGWPVSSVLLTVVRDEKGDGHAV